MEDCEGLPTATATKPDRGPSQSLSSEALCLAGLRDEAGERGVLPCCVSGSGFCPCAVVPWHAVSETPQAGVGAYIRFPESGCPQPSAGAPVSEPLAKSHLCPCPTLHTVGALTTSDSSPSHLGSPSHSHNPVVRWGKLRPEVTSIHSENIWVSDCLRV